jgi:hypothetical protein
MSGINGARGSSIQPPDTQTSSKKNAAASAQPPRKPPAPDIGKRPTSELNVAAGAPAGRRTGAPRGAASSPEGAFTELRAGVSDPLHREAAIRRFATDIRGSTIDAGFLKSGLQEIARLRTSKTIDARAFQHIMMALARSTDGGKMKAQTAVEFVEAIGRLPRHETEPGMTLAALRVLAHAVREAGAPRDLVEAAGRAVAGIANGFHPDVKKRLTPSSFYALCTAPVDNKASNEQPQISSDSSRPGKPLPQAVSQRAAGPLTPSARNLCALIEARTYTTYSELAEKVAALAVGENLPDSDLGKLGEVLANRLPIKVDRSKLNQTFNPEILKMVADGNEVTLQVFNELLEPLEPPEDPTEPQVEATAAARLKKMMSAIVQVLKKQDPALLKGVDGKVVDLLTNKGLDPNVRREMINLLREITGDPRITLTLNDSKRSSPAQ